VGKTIKKELEMGKLKRLLKKELKKRKRKRKGKKLKNLRKKRQKHPVLEIKVLKVKIRMMVVKR
jgi:hypothetical protein